MEVINIEDDVSFFRSYGYHKSMWSKRSQAIEVHFSGFHASIYYTI